MSFEEIFINQAGRFRSGWRFMIFMLAFIFFATLFGGAASVILSGLAVDFTQGSLLFIMISSSISLTLALSLGWLCGKFLEDLPLRALGAWFTKNWLKDLILGLAIGAVSIGLGVLIAAVFGGLSFNFNQNHGITAILLTAAVSLVVFAVAAAFEEAFFRGYILQTFLRANLTWFAIILTSIFFAAAHLQNSSANYISSINTLLAGFWFGVAYLKTRNLWFPFGLHLIWNWLQGAIFGIEVSGNTNFATAPLFQEIDTGPAWLTGGEYGIEGGIACTIAIVSSTVLIWFAPFLKPTDEMLALTSEENSLPSKSFES